VLYISELIGPNVVNTMPEATLGAFADHGTVSRTLDADPDGAQRTLLDAATAGVDLDTIMAELEGTGVHSFCDSYDQPLACITSKLRVVGAVDRRATEEGRSTEFGPPPAVPLTEPL
jgi:transaldolase